MSFDAAQILRQTYAAGAEAARMREMAEPVKAAQVQQRGEVMGTAFTVEADPVAELMDSMEELSFQFEERETKRVADRKMGQANGPSSAFVKALEAWAAMMPDMPGRGRLEKLMQSLREAFGGSMLSPEEILRQLGRESSDPSLQFAMLDLLEQMCEEKDGGLLAQIRQAKAMLMGEKGAEIRVGINLAGEVNARATTPEEMGELRDLYRSEVVGFTKPQECFRSLIAARGAQGLKSAIDFLISGCSADIGAATPSIERAALERILVDLQCVHVLQTVMESLEQLSARMAKQFGEHCLLGGEELTGRVLDLTEQAFVTSPAIAALIGETGVAKLLARMDFARELVRLFRRLSSRLFANEGERQRLVEAAQEHLDDLITEENETEGGEA